jgi:N6-L-threonylcarbamoyladenine synthase
VSFNLNIPLIGINHLYSHIYASFLQPQNGKMKSKVAFTPQNKRKKICDLPTVSGFAKLPFVGLVVSGGHTSLFYVKDFDKIELIGRTLDDACGEAFDKVAKILGLGYPGGPVIERLAKEGNAKGIKFSCSRTLRPLDFSFSGIKTAVLYYVRRLGGQPANRQTEDIAASFQETVINVLVRKSLLACRLKRVNSLVLGGGVVANNRLRKRFCEESRQSGVNVYFPPKELSMDNAAMVAGLGYGLFKKGHRASLDLNAELN